MTVGVAVGGLTVGVADGGAGVEVGVGGGGSFPQLSKNSAEAVRMLIMVRSSAWRVNTLIWMSPCYDALRLAAMALQQAVPLR